MFRWQRFKAILVGRNLEFWRDRAAMSWNVAFPLLLIVAFSVVFSGEGKNQLKIGITNASQVPTELIEIKYTEFVIYQDKKAALARVAQHQIDLLLDWQKKTYYVNDSSPKGYIAESLLGRLNLSLSKQQISGEPIRYVDWVIPGILGMNMMFSCLFGVGYVIVRYRKSGVLKRLHATPVTASEFIAAQILSRLIIVCIISSAIFLTTWWTIDYLVKGSLILLFIILVLGSLSLISLGLMIAARSKSEELTGGLLNLASWPMMLLSGVWFSLEGAPEFVKIVSQFLPLTHFVDAARAVMTEGASLSAISYNLLAMLSMSIIFFTIAAASFSWGKQR
ncbi:MAG: ABC transporter permease [Kangiellaceae bacterium]|jgi:ABC-type multidrug transport system permease subunit|nr:ABC transporter permease [Kangiellaceae bacterium]